MIDDETLNMSVRRFLKRFGIEAQRTIEEAVRQADANGDLGDLAAIGATITLRVESLDAGMELKDDIALR